LKIVRFEGERYLGELLRKETVTDTQTDRENVLAIECYQCDQMDVVSGGGFVGGRGSAARQSFLLVHWTAACRATRLQASKLKLFFSCPCIPPPRKATILPAAETELKLSPRQPPWSSDCILASHNNPYDFLNPAYQHTGTEREEQTLWFGQGQPATRTQDCCVAGYHAEAIVAMMDPRTRDMGLTVSCLMFCSL
jgi:hypothetical protein